MGADGPRLRGREPAKRAGGGQNNRPKARAKRERSAEMESGATPSMTTTRAVRVAMVQLIIGGPAHVLDFDLEVQRLAGQRVIAVERDLGGADLGDPQRDDIAGLV